MKLKYCSTILLLTGLSVCSFTSLLPLAVLSELKAQGKDKTIELSWKAAQEINTNAYELQHSVDGTSFETIALIFPWGNTEQINQYRYTDNIPYRELITTGSGSLKMILRINTHPLLLHRSI